MPPNYGPEFTEQFRLCYSDLARDKKVPLVPFLLNDIAQFPNLLQADGIHPNEPGQPQIIGQCVAVVETAAAPLGPAAARG